MLVAKTLDDMPVECRERFEELLAGPRIRVATLVDELAEYLGAVHQLEALSSAIDLGTAERIAGVLQGLLAAHGAYADDAQRLVEAAVAYFVREDDDEEITGVLGFDDDIQVINAVLRAVGRPDLVLPFRRVDLEP
jgi:hypothetical protein